MMNVLIVDDEKNARAALRGMIESNFPEIQAVDEAENLPDAVKKIRKLKPQVVLLDIEMPGYLGIDILDFFDPQDIDFKVIFVTAYNEYALKAFDLAAVDYLLKPTRVEQLKRAFLRVKQECAPEKGKYFALKENLDSRSLQKLAIQTGEGLVVTEVKNIRYFKANGAYTHIHFVDGQRITVTRSLHEYNLLEESRNFFRVNRSYIINVDCISKISKKDGGFVQMDNGDEISATLEKRQILQSFFAKRTI